MGRRWGGEGGGGEERENSLHIIIQMEVIQILSMNQKIQHIITLSTNLKSSLNPIK